MSLHPRTSYIVRVTAASAPRLLCLAWLAALVPAALHAQSLRGSRASVERMARYARTHHLPRYETATGLRRAAAKGLLVPLRGGAYKLHRVAYPYVLPETRSFVDRLAAQYRAACKATLVITSASRPARAQPWNSVPESVHTSGMAVDLRKPDSGPCRAWLRRTLLALEKDGVIEATEEYGPPHFHVAVYGVPYRRSIGKPPIRPGQRRTTPRS